VAMTRPKQARKIPYMPRRVLPPISRRLGSTEFDGFDILEEYPGSPGLVLWFARRDAELWATITERRGLFADPPGQWGELIPQLDSTFAPISRPLRLLASLTADHEATAVASGCDAVAEWSEQQSRLGTAVEFAQVASIADPACPQYAARTARLLKGRAEWDRSTSWYDSAIFIARRVEDWSAYADACCGLGDLHFERGNLSKSVAKSSVHFYGRHPCGFENLRTGVEPWCECVR